MTKRKANTNKKYFNFGGDTKRFFRIQEVQGIDQTELALCYYSSPKEKNPRGSLFLKDVGAIDDDGRCLTLTSISRVMTLEAPTLNEHRLWLNTVIELCLNADIKGAQSATAEAISKLNQRKQATEAKLQHVNKYLDQSENDKLKTDETPGLRNRRDDDGRNSSNNFEHGDETANPDISTDRDDRRDRRKSGREKSKGASTRGDNGRGEGERDISRSPARDKGKSDHRIHQPPRSGDGTGATSRLHGHILRDTETPQNPKTPKPQNPELI